ncbi:MAG TPA: hypothetical protein VN894_03800, partial [Polyangiaceae bacterium]|nr:hypothetical protein [Polyangiaceae bacterium]
MSRCPLLVAAAIGLSATHAACSLLDSLSPSVDNASAASDDASTGGAPTDDASGVDSPSSSSGQSYGMADGYAPTSLADGGSRNNVMKGPDA